MSLVPNGSDRRITPVTYGALCSQASAFSSKYSQRSHCHNRVLSDFLNTLDFKLGKSKFSLLTKTSVGISEPSKICTNLIVFNSASDWLIEKSLKFCLGGHGLCSRTVIYNIHVDIIYCKIGNFHLQWKICHLCGLQVVS